MPRSSRQKQKILVIARYLMRETDEDHPATLEQILAHLRRHGIEAERKSVYADLEELRDFGLDVICTRSKHVGYFIGDREFEPSEVRLLVDAVQSSRFLTMKKSRALIEKLQTLLSRPEANALSRTVYVAGRIKTMNESVFNNVDAVSRAIEEGRMISFRYFERNANGEKVFRHEGERYVVSPGFLVWDDENYYLVAREKGGEKRHYRVDKMCEIRRLDEKREEAFWRSVDPVAYEKKTFGMFGGREERVTIRCAAHLAGVFYDRFGADPLTRPVPGGFEITVPVMVSPLFYAWLMGFGREVRIVSPEAVAEEFRELARSALSAYEEEA